MNILNNAGQVPLDILVNTCICNLSHNSFALPFTLAVYNSYDTKVAKEMLYLIMKSGGDPNNVFRGQNSPLLLAVKNQISWIVEFLLETGANLMHIGENQETALDLCLKGKLRCYRI